MDRHCWRSLASFALALVGSAAFAGKPEYRMVPLGTPPEIGQVFGGAIDSQNRVVWQSWNATVGTYTGYISFNGKATPLADLGIPDNFGGYTRNTAAGRLYGRGTYFEGGQQKFFPGVSEPPHSNRTVFAMNDSGTAVGEIVENFSGYTKGYVFENGVPRVQNIPGAFETIYTDINASGKIVGWSSPGGGNLITYDRGKWEDLTSLIPAPSFFNTARNARYQINDNGVIAYNDFQLIPDGKGGYISKLLPARSDGSRFGHYHLNNKNQMVGIDVTPVTLATRATFYDGENSYFLDEVCAELPVGNGFKTYGLDINDNGWILGAYVTPDNIHHGFVMQPVPEPGTLLLMGGGIGLMARRRRKRDI